MLRATIRKLKRLVLALAAYEHHITANKCASQLRLHSLQQLKDIGFDNKESIQEAAHAKCPWCHHHVWQVWTKGC